MYKRTFEVLAKYFASENGATVVFDTNGGASASVDKKTIHLPKEIGSENAFSALACLAHEAAHIKYTCEIPRDIVDTAEDHDILNVIEDCRIDHKNFHLLENMYEFYIEQAKKIDLTKASEDQLLLINAILDDEGLRCHIPDESMNLPMDYDKMCRISREIRKGSEQIGGCEWKKVKETIENIKNILNEGKQKQPTPEPEPEQGKGECKPNESGDKTDEEGSKGQAPNSSGNGKPGKYNIDNLLHPDSCYGIGTGEGMKGSSNSNEAISPLAMSAQSEAMFKEILSIKERKTVDNGIRLDTDSLTALFTGDIKELFKEDKDIKIKKSKIVFLLDASGSMGATLIDNKARYKVVASCVDRLTKILDEVSQLEGINVDWEIGMFRGGYTILSKEHWRQDYYDDGGTNFGNAFQQCIESLVSDYTVDGKKIIICFTDGDVYDHEIDFAKHLCQQHFKDVRAMIIGVGTQLTGHMARELLGDNIVIAEANADEVLLRTIETML